MTKTEIINLVMKEAKEFSSQDTLNAYMKNHPGADPKNHSVKDPTKRNKTEIFDSIQEKKKQLKSKHIGTEEEAKDFTKGSKFTHTMTHGTSEEAYNSILQKGFHTGNRGAVFFDISGKGTLSEAYGAGKTLNVKVNVKNVIQHKEVYDYINKAKTEGIKLKGEEGVHKYLKSKGIDAIVTGNEIAVLDPTNIMIIKE
jgi:hypothetical protein